MFFRKNKYRHHTCGWCGHNELNIYYGYKSSDDLPIIGDFRFRELHRDKCSWCGKYYYYITREE